MRNRAGLSPKKTILFISHDASRTGAPIELLYILRWLRGRIPNPFRILLRQKGPLEPLFREIAEVVNAEETHIEDISLQDVGLIYSNTITNGSFLEMLPYGNIPVLTHVHEMEYVIGLHGRKNLEEVKRHTVHYIACSGATADVLSHIYGIYAANISTIPEAVCPSDIVEKSLAKESAEIRKALCIEEGAFLVLGCGTRDLRKGIDLFIQLAGFCARNKRGGRKLEFLWVGSSNSDSISDMLQKDIMKLGEKLHIRFIDGVDNPYPYIAAADLFCLPSREDPFPLVMLEAGALGKPTLAFKQSGGAEEYCVKGGGYAVPYLDIAAMGNFIIRILKNKKAISVAGRRAKRLVQNKFNIEVTGPKYALLMERFLREDCVSGSGMSQLFIPSAKGYSEEASILKQVQASEWNRLSFMFRASGPNSNWSVRLDPLDRIGIIEIDAMALKSGDGRLIWKANRARDFQAVRVEGSAIRLVDKKRLKLLSYGLDPSVYLPDLAIDAKEQEFRLEVIMRANCGLDPLARHWPLLFSIYRDNGGICDSTERRNPRLPDFLNRIERVGLDLLFRGGLIKDRPIFVWGTGMGGRRIGDVLFRHGYQIQGFIDSDPEKSGKELAGSSVFAPSVLELKSETKPFIIIGSQFHHEIGLRLKTMGLAQGSDFEVSPFISPQ